MARSCSRAYGRSPQVRSTIPPGSSPTGTRFATSTFARHRIGRPFQMVSSTTRRISDSDRSAGAVCGSCRAAPVALGSWERFGHSSVAPPFGTGDEPWHQLSLTPACDRYRRVDRHRLRACEMLRPERLRPHRRSRRAADQEGCRGLPLAIGATVTAVEADLATREASPQLYEKAAAQGRPVEALLANAGRGLGKGFLDQDFEDVRHVIDTNVTGTLDLIQKVGRDMRASGKGRILITGSIAGFMPGTFQAAYNGSKAFLDSFSFALAQRAEGHRHHGHLPDARRDRHRVLRACRHDGHQGRPGEEGRSGRSSRRSASTR